MTPPDGSGSTESTRRMRGVTFVTLVKIAALAIAACLAAVLASRLLSWNPWSWIGSLFGSYTEVRTLHTLLSLTEVVEMDEVLGEEYFGEVLVSAAELKNEVITDFERSYREYKKCADDGKEPTEAAKDSLLYWFLSTRFPAVDFPMTLNEFEEKAADYVLKRPTPSPADESKEKARQDAFRAFLMGGMVDESKEGPTRKAFHAFLMGELNDLGKDFNESLVYLARGSVRIWYDVETVLEDSECRDAEKQPVESCDLRRVSEVVTPLGRARRIRTTVNPYFSYDEKTLTEEYTHGWEVIRAGDQLPKNFEMLRALRILAHQNLQRLALEQGILDHADASFAQTLKRMIKLFFDKSVDVDFKAESAIPICSGETPQHDAITSKHEDR